ncbi:Cupin domain protein [Clostridiales bacterium CHKCI001]|nr:Cupin domain protein [Clostridiales bacterium CHKCI001]
MNYCYCTDQTDHGSNPYATNIEQIATQNHNFRTAIWTGCYLQMTLMCISPCEDIGLEIHPNTDQLIRVEQGKAMIKMGRCECQLDFQQTLCNGDAVFIPAGTWHNIINIGRNPLKLSSIYAPPNHPKGTIHCTKADAQEYEE